MAEAAEEVESLRGELALAVGAAAASNARQESAETKVAELEGLLNNAIREHARFREQTEKRLEDARAAFEEEERENGVQVCMYEFEGTGVR